MKVEDQEESGEQEQSGEQGESGEQKGCKPSIQHLMF
jgi:hypothetical protein